MLNALAIWFALLVSGPVASAQGWNAAPQVDTSVMLQPVPPAPIEYLATAGTYATFYYRGLDRHTAEMLAEHAAQRIPEIAEVLGVPTGRAMHIFLAHDQHAFETLQPGKTHDWADGTAWPHRSLIYLRSPRVRPGTAKPLTQVLDHEITHVLLGQAFGPRPVPTWLQEGLAQWVAGEIGPEIPERIGRGQLSGGLLTLEDLSDGFPREAHRADLAYAQSADLIAYLAGEYGPEVLPTLIGEMAQGASVNAALLHATGDRSDQIDRAWRGRLAGSGLWFTALANDSFFFALGVPLALLAGIGVRRRRRKVLERWEEEERLQEQWVAQLQSQTFAHPVSGVERIH
jgi:hypothetical protein